MLNSASGDLFKKTYFLAKPYGRKKLAFVLFCCLLQGIFQVIGVTSIFPFLALVANPGIIYNSEIGQKILGILPEMSENEVLLLAGLLAIAMIVAANVVNVVTEYIRTRYANSLGHWLRIRLLEQYSGKPYIYFLDVNPGILNKKVLGDVQSFVSAVLLPMIDTAARLVTAFLLILTLFLVDPFLATMAAVVFAGFYVVVFRILRNQRNRIVEGLKQAQRGSFISLIQFIGGIKPVFAKDCSKYFIRRFSLHSKNIADLNTLVPIFSSVPRYLIEPIAFGGIVVFIMSMIASGSDVISAIPKLGVIAMAGYRLLPTFQLLYGQISQFSSMRHTLDEVYEEFLDQDQDLTPLEINREPLKFGNAITLQNLTFKYPSRKQPVLKNINLTIPKYSSVAFVGSTGSGKSTLVDLLMGLLTRSEGDIRVDDQSLTRNNFPLWRQKIGYVPQDIYLIDDTLTRNIAFGLEDDDIDVEQVRKVCRMAQILDFIEGELDEGFDTVVGDRGVRLSGGQKQRIGLARALYDSPELLILDEATSALDNQTELALMNAIHALFGKFTIVMIAHRLTTVKDCDTIFFLEQGELIAQGGFQQLQDENQKFRQLVESRH